MALLKTKLRGKLAHCDDEVTGDSAALFPCYYRRRKRRRKESGNRLELRQWSSASLAIATAAAFLLLPSCHNLNPSTNCISVVAQAQEATEPYPYDNWEDADIFFEDELDNQSNTVSLEGGETKENSEPLAKKGPPEGTHSHRTMEEELQLHAEHQHNTNERIVKERSINEKEQKEYKQYMDWCRQVLGISTSLEVHTFYYYDYMKAIMANPESQEADTDDDDDFEMDNPADTATTPPSTDNNNIEEEWQDPPMIPVRGLRATRNISRGEVIISIPFQALLTVSTTIDQDPVLSRVMGPSARQAYGWTLGQDNDSERPENLDSVDFFELPLLAMALLHHYKLGTSSPLYPYIHLLRKSPLDSMPFLWSKEKRRKHFGGKYATSTVAKGIQTVARSIRLEMKDMYHTVVDTLVQKHPDLFGRRNDNGQTQQYDILDDEDWAFSFENFQWAFAMVNSRHWLLPIVDLDTHPPSESPPATPMLLQPQGSVDGVPPAEMPTDAWVDQNLEQDGEDNQEGENNQGGSEQPQPRNTDSTTPRMPAYHSFLAPVADLLNFGPPCTRGRYNQETHNFDIIASCNFTPGQEVTFWYSDECEEIVIGNYGFTHPMVPKCPTAEDYRAKAEKWKQRTTNLQEALEDAYEDMDVMDTELQHVQQILASCDCCGTARAATNVDYQHQPNEQGQDILGQYQKPGHQPQGNVDGLHGNYLRNPHDAPPSQIRGGGGTMMSRSSANRINVDGSGGSDVRDDNSARSRRPRDDQRSRNRPRGRAGSDDDVERHGVRRMWAGRSAL